jgi:hypothetical protein
MLWKRKAAMSFKPNRNNSTYHDNQAGVDYEVEGFVVVAYYSCWHKPEIVNAKYGRIESGHYGAHYYPCPWLIGVAEQCHYRWEIEKEKSEQNYNSRVPFSEDISRVIHSV